MKLKPRLPYFDWKVLGPRPILHGIVQTARTAPASVSLCAAWVLVYGLMAAWQGSLHAGRDWLAGGITTTVSNLFGHLTAAQLGQGEVWRPLTATFVHYSLVHLAMNLVGLWLLGPLVESWYGWGQMLGLYVVIGYVGNLLASLPKLLGPAIVPVWLLQPDYPCGGGSTVICGLVALLAIVGWRSRVHFGDGLWFQMVLVLVLTAGLGLLVPNVDNLGHAGGTLVGLALGLVEQVLLRNHERGRAVWLGVAAALALGAAAGAQFAFVVNQSRSELDLQRVQQELNDAAALHHQLVELERLYRQRAQPTPSILLRRDLAALPRLGIPRGALLSRLRRCLEALESAPELLKSGPTAAAFHQVVELTRQALERPPTIRELVAFEAALRPVAARNAEVALSRRALLELLVSSPRFARPDLGRAPGGSP